MKEKINIRIIHRYLGFFLAGIMLVYGLSGIILIYRDTDIFTVITPVEKRLNPNNTTKLLGKNLRIKNLKITKTDGDTLFFKQGFFNTKTGIANYTAQRLPFILLKMTNLHKADIDKPLYWLNTFFGLSLLFFAISSFWMFLPKTKVFKKGLIFTAIGLITTLLLLFLT